MMTKEILNEIDTLINELENLKKSSVISKEYQENLSHYVKRLTNKTRHLLMFYKIENKTNLLTFHWNTVKTSYDHLPKMIHYVLISKEEKDMSEIELSNYLMNRNCNYNLAKKEFLLKKYADAKIVKANLNKDNIIVFTLYIK